MFEYILLAENKIERPDLLFLMIDIDTFTTKSHSLFK